MSNTTTTTNTTVDLSTSDDAFARLEAEPSLPGRERATTSATWFLTALIGLGGAFIGGAAWGQRHTKTPTATTATTVAGQGRSSGTGTQTGSGQGGTGQAAIPTTVLAPATSGTIKLVDGRNVYVSTADGRTIKLVLGADGKVQVPAAGAITDLAAGNNVMWSGTTNADGTVTAATVTRT
jgi:hypothetical protein